MSEKGEVSQKFDFRQNEGDNAFRQPYRGEYRNKKLRILSAK
jgi:hypothetical protein